jgi:hypothetical protein
MADDPDAYKTGGVIDLIDDTVIPNTYTVDAF